VKYKRILVKISGEMLAPAGGSGIDINRLNRIGWELAALARKKIEVAVVIGGGNIWRGAPASESGFDRVTGDYMGMVATIINALALQQALEKLNLRTRVLTAIDMAEIAEPYIRRRAIRHLEKGRIIILAGGTGSPYFSTDTAAALRAIEINADVILKATKVDGVYTADPLIDKKAKKFNHITYLKTINLRLKIMDSTALSLCFDNHIPIIVFNLNKQGQMLKVVQGEKIGTVIS